MQKRENLKYRNYMMVTLKIAVLSAGMIVILAIIASNIRKSNSHAQHHENQQWQVMNSY